MFHSKLLTMHFGASAVISSINRMQHAIDANATRSIGSITIAANYPCRHQHVMSTGLKKKFLQNPRNYSVLGKKYSNVVSIYAFSQIERNVPLNRKLNVKILF